MKITHSFIMGKAGLVGALSTVAAFSTAQSVDQSDLEFPPVCTVTAPLSKIVMEPEGSVLKVKLDTKLQSNVAHEGDKFTATLAILCGLSRRQAKPPELSNFNPTQFCWLTVAPIQSWRRL